MRGLMTPTHVTMRGLMTPTLDGMWSSCPRHARPMT